MPIQSKQPNQTRRSLTQKWKTVSENLADRVLGSLEEARIFLPSSPAPREMVFVETLSQEANGTIQEIKQDIRQLDMSSLVLIRGNLRARVVHQGGRKEITIEVDALDRTVILSLFNYNPTEIEKIILIFQKPDRLPITSTPQFPPTPIRRVGFTATWSPNDKIDIYTLHKRLGTGYSSEVWEAEVSTINDNLPLRTGQRVALKMYLSHMLRERVESLRIQREFHVAYEINHPNIVRVFDLVMSPSRGYSFIAMQLVNGDTLKNRIPSRGLPIPDTVRIGQQIFEALRELHSRRALHRDVKAANIMVTSEVGEPFQIVILDLGIVSLATDLSLTNPTTFLGSKHTAPLEQLSGELVTERSDIYAAGATLYHCLTGAPMYDREGPEGAIVKKMIHAPLQLTVRTSAGSQERKLVDFINRCVKVEASERPGSARACAEELSNISGESAS